MSQKPDDLDAVRAIVKALEEFEPKEQERIIRWAREKLGLWVSAEEPSSIKDTEKHTEEHEIPKKPQFDIKTFIKSKQPKSDRQLVAVVAYYYKYEAPQNQRKDFITKDDILEACRLAVIERPERPEQSLVHAKNAGFVDSGQERGTYAINSVGENLVAMALPSGSDESSQQKRKRGK